MEIDRNPEFSFDLFAGFSFLNRLPYQKKLILYCNIKSYKGNFCNQILTERIISPKQAFASLEIIIYTLIIRINLNSTKL